MSQPGHSNQLDRRDFLLRAAKAGALIAAVGGTGLLLHDRKGPSGIEASDTVSLPDFTFPSSGPKMSIVTGADRVKTVNRALTALGGIERFIKSGDRVLLKVNAAFASPASLSATTHPDLVAEVARLCLRAGAASVIVTDNPINDPQSCFALTGIEKAAESSGAKVIQPSPSAFKPTTLAGGTLIKDWPLLFDPFQGVTKLIGLAPVKEHYRSGASLTMKNWYGLLGGRRNVFHQDIHTIIFELARMVRPTLVILDGTMSMLTNGPTGGSLGDLKATNTMIVSTDAVAADAFGATLIGRTVASLPYIVKTAAAGLGTADFESLNPVRDHVE